MSTNPSPEVKSIVKQTPDLTTALSNEPVGVAGILLSKDLISLEVYSKILLQTYTPTEKVAFMLESTRKIVEIDPEKFPEFVEVLSGQTCTEVAKRLQSTYQSLLNQVDDSGSSEELVDIASKIETLEDQFDSLRTRIIDELSAKPGPITVQRLLDTLTSLPLSLKREYESLAAERIPKIDAETQVNRLFILHLNPLTSFIDYGLIEHIIRKFGSDSLKKDMQSYCCDMQTFMKQTTIQQLINFLPGKQEIPQNFTILRAKIGENASMCTLDRINTLRKRFCAELQLSEVVFCLIALEDSNSFIISWLVPSVLAPDLVECTRNFEQAFFDEENILSLSIGNQWIRNPKLIPFGLKLGQKYQQSRGSPSPVEWIPSPTKKIFRLAMIQREKGQRGLVEDRFVQMTVHGRVDDILHAKSPVELEHIFRNAIHGSEIILIEGAPGSGKSTLTVHICQRWGKGELFQQFTVVILVQLRDPVVQRAQTIADLLPVENATVAQELATELIATNGRGVLWVLDGWDELPPHLQQDSIFCKLLPPEPSVEKLAQLEQDPVYREYVHSGYSKVELWILYLHKNPVFQNQYYKDWLLGEASVIVTSRPISSGDLHSVVSSRFEVLGFTPEEQRQYFTECLKGDTKALEALLEKIQENPVVQSICYLPLNAAFIVHTFKYMGQLLPSTEYEIYLSIILSCIQRHFEREGRGHNLPRELTSFGDLSRSEAVREPFRCLCELAYHGVMENKVTFSSSDLPQGSNTLSLLQAIESFLQSGKSVFYNFLHLSIQEVLSAYYIATWLSDSEQMSQFQQLFNQPRFAAVFQFYAAITKLKTPEIRQVIDRIVKESTSHYRNQPKPRLVSLLRCLYEAQDPSLCHYVAEQLDLVGIPNMQYVRLDLRGNSLSPLDCLSVSLFLSSAGMAIEGDFDECSIGDLGAKSLSKHIDHGVDHVGKVTLNLVVRNNDIHEEGASYIARTVNVIEHLHLSRNPIGDTGASLISEAVSKAAVLKTLSLSCCGITSKCASHIAKVLYFIEYLYLTNNPIGDTGVSLISEAIRETATLKTLTLFSCCITSRGAEDLSRVLAQNSSLEKLDIGKNVLGDEGVSHVAEALKQNRRLKELCISHCGMTDKGAASLASALSVNNSLKILHMGEWGEGELTEDGLSKITQSLDNNSDFVKLAISDDFDSVADHLCRKVNEARKRKGLPSIEIEATPVCGFSFF